MARVDSSPRDRLVEAGARLLERDGPEAVQARRVAAEVGTSTMAVYTHFGGMDGLVQAIVEAAFHRFGEALAAVQTTDDPVADLFVMGHAYRDFAISNPQRYRLMFGLATPQLSYRPDPGMPVTAPTFGQLMTAVQRILATGRIRHDDVVDLAGRIWAMTHGVVLLEIVDTFEHDGRALTHILEPMMVDLLVGMGDRREATETSLERSVATIADMRQKGGGS